MKGIRAMSNNGKNDVIEFFVGLAMTCVGGYLFLQNVEVFSGNIFAFYFGGRNMEGVVFIPLIASIIFLFYKYNTVSKICCGLSLLIIIANVIMNLRMYWKSTTLFVTICIFVLLFGGIGLVARALFANPDGAHGKDYSNMYGNDKK